jgi:hypothetical protein
MSDASAYQIALFGLRLFNRKYDNYWFIHTKSSVNSHSDYLRSWYIKTFIGDRKNIEDFFKQNKEIGSYGKLGLECDYKKLSLSIDCQIPLVKNKITKALPYCHNNFYYIHTLYVIHKKPMRKFMRLITDKWFNTKLDRYYFEGIFPFIVSRSGYFPYLENRISCSGIDLLPLNESWIKENKLEKYDKFINSYKTNYSFHQLYPPYVNSYA